MKKFYLIVLCLYALPIWSQPSPWGNGLVQNISLDSLAIDSTWTSHTGFSTSLNNYLDNYNYNIYIPPGYDGTKAYGLITFINAGNTGSIWSQWQPVLDQKNIILIAGNGIGNSVFVPDRMGVALAGAYALSQSLNIDTNRIYTSGNSGGGRTASVLMYLYPEFFKAMIPNCGSAYLRQVAQDYETHQPNSNYEYLYQFTPTELEYVRNYNRRVSLLTAYNDFREGDLMNIYHNGNEPDGFEAKLLDIPGNHCATTSQHFLDGLNFIEHPHLALAVDSFQANSPIKGSGYLLKGAQINSSLSLGDTLSNVRLLDPLRWNDQFGAVMRLEFSLNSASSSENEYLNLGLYDLADSSFYQQIPNPDGQDLSPYFLIRYITDSIQPQVIVLYNNPRKGFQQDTIFRARFVDWDNGDRQRLKIHAWNNEWRIEFGAHFDVPITLGQNVKLLDDDRSVQFLNQSNWDSTDFGAALISFSAARKVAGAAQEPKIHVLNFYVADTTNAGMINNIGLLEEISDNFEMFPNPTGAELNLIFPYPWQGLIQVLDIHGRIIRSIPHQGQKQTLLLNDLPSGIYLISAPEIGLSKKLILDRN